MKRSGKSKQQNVVWVELRVGGGPWELEKPGWNSDDKKKWRKMYNQQWRITPVMNKQQ